jgi:hypothetical protein
MATFGRDYIYLAALLLFSLICWVIMLAGLASITVRPSPFCPAGVYVSW